MEFVSRILVIAGGLNWLSASLLNRDALGWAFEALGAPLIARIVYGLVGLSALLLVLSRDFYLPFLGDAAFPSGVVGEERAPESATMAVRVPVRGAAPGAKVVYWASEPANSVVPTPSAAYGEGRNAGVARVDAHGQATFRVRPPSEYRVGWGRRVRRHIHYRVANGPSGLFGRVETVFV